MSTLRQRKREQRARSKRRRRYWRKGTNPMHPWAWLVRKHPSLFGPSPLMEALLFPSAPTPPGETIDLLPVRTITTGLRNRTRGPDASADFSIAKRVMRCPYPDLHAPDCDCEGQGGGR